MGNREGNCGEHCTIVQESIITLTIGSKKLPRGLTTLFFFFFKLRSPESLSALKKSRHPLVNTDGWHLQSMRILPKSHLNCCSPQDSVHTSYPSKIVTGRKNAQFAFMTLCSKTCLQQNVKVTQTVFKSN